PAPVWIVTFGTVTMYSGIAAGQTLIVHDADGAGMLRTPYPGAILTNAGSLYLWTVEGSNPITVQVPSGTFYNTSTGTLAVEGVGARTLAANLYNEGTINIATDTSVGGESATEQNFGTLALHNGATLTVAGNNNFFDQVGGLLDTNDGRLLMTNSW